MSRSKVMLLSIAAAAGCSEDPATEPPPQAVIDTVEPAAICTATAISATEVTITGENLDQPLEVEWEDAAGGPPFPDLDPVAGEDGTTLVLDFEPGEWSPPQAQPPKVLTLHLLDEHGRSTEHADALTYYANFTPFGIEPATGAGVVAITIDGSGFYGDISITLDAASPVVATDVEVVYENTITAQLDLTGVAAGTYAVTMTRPGGCDETLEDGFTIE